MKNVKKCIIILMAISILCSAFAGCGKISNNDKFYNEADPIVVTDGANRMVSFKNPVKTVATSWGGGVDNYIYALGVSDRLVATNSKHNLDRKFFNPDDMPKVGRWALDNEALAEISPDLYLHGFMAIDYLNAANKVGIPAYGMGFNTFEDINKNLLDLGKIFGVEEQAQFVVDRCNEIMSMIDKRVSKIPDNQRPTVIILGSKEGELASDIFDTVEVMTARAGGISLTPEDVALNTETTIVGLEAIFKWNPDYIFIQDAYCESTVDDIMSDSTWASMKAVQNDNVYAIPCDLDAWCKATPSCCLGSLYMSIKMYPELYADVDFNQVVTDFYKDVYGLEITAEDIGEMK